MGLCLAGHQRPSSATFFDSSTAFPYEMKRSFSEKDTEETVEDEEKHLSMKRCVIADISAANWKSGMNKFVPARM
jgi:hypothetical protein